MNKRIIMLVSLLVILIITFFYVIISNYFIATVHNVAITKVAVSTTQLFIGDTLNITATAKNKGTIAETFNVTSYFNETVVGTKTVTGLAPGAQINLTFGWNAAEISPANYIIKAQAIPIQNETDTTDNTYIFSFVQARRKPNLQATLFTDPEAIWRPVGQDFTIKINVADIIDLYGWEFRLGWNVTVLDATSVVEGPFLKSGGANTFFFPSVNSTAGRMLVECTSLGNRPGISGGGTLATIQFHVKESGHCDLDLYDTKLLSSFEQPMIHLVNDGHFNT